MRTAVATTAVLALAALLGAAAVVWSGVYDIAATTQHLPVTHALLERAMRQSVRLRARSVDVPALERADRVPRGALCFRVHCEQCHGGPGVAPAPIGRSMQPLPGPLHVAAHDWRPAELYWITRHGIKMSGMPAWAYRMDDDDLWSVVAFLQRLPDLLPADYRALPAPAGPACERGRRGERGEAGRQAAGGRPGEAAAAAVAEVHVGAGDARRGRQVLPQYGCNACHVIPGITGPDVHVGPPLAGMARRRSIAGSLPNTPEQMVRWLRDPHAVDAATAMPALGLTDSDARDAAAYLATLH